MNNISKANKMEEKLLEYLGSECLLNEIIQWLGTYKLEEIYEDILNDYDIDFE